MKLEDVLPALREGKKVTRRYWRDGDFIQLVDVAVKFSCGERFTLGSGMLEADDWEVVEEKRELSWEEIDRAIKDGVNLVWVDYLASVKKQLGFTD